MNKIGKKILSKVTRSSFQSMLVLNFIVVDSTFCCVGRQQTRIIAPTFISINGLLLTQKTINSTEKSENLFLLDN